MTSKRKNPSSSNSTSKRKRASDHTSAGNKKSRKNAVGSNTDVKRRYGMSGLGPQARLHVPRNALIIRSILKDMGVEKFKPRVIDQLMEFFHRHVQDILEDAYDYQQHAKNKNMSSQDIKLAIHNKLAYSFLGPPPAELIAARAKDVNRVPLEKVSEAGIPPPASRFLLTTPNFELNADDASSVEDGN
mmetsp:Transcript_32233/g.52350  ORF Transcript_32233/g.52350 Transcript_32233/m.52350 type:complete len:188 (-) Transcript_32233:134-697(-)